MQEPYKNRTRTLQEPYKNLWRENKKNKKIGQNDKIKKSQSLSLIWNIPQQNIML